MNKQEFNRLAAEFLGFDVICNLKSGAVSCRSERGARDFNPYDDANDMLLLEAKLQICTFPYYDSGEFCSTIDSQDYYGAQYGKTPHESRRACAEEYLKEWKK